MNNNIKIFKRNSIKRELLLVFVFFNNTHNEIKDLSLSLKNLSPKIGYALAINGQYHKSLYRNIFDNADLVINNPDNPGYGKAINLVFKNLDYEPKYIGAQNIDIYWECNTFERMIKYMNDNSNIHLSTPLIYDQTGSITKLCKNNPSIISLLSRRFIPNYLKISFLKNIDNKFINTQSDYKTIFKAEYLSGCCMVIRCSIFKKIGGFDERFFLHFEDADISRTISKYGDCIHFPYSKIIHKWERANKHSFKITIIALISAFKYFRKWGVKLY